MPPWYYKVAGNYKTVRSIQMNILRHLLFAFSFLIAIVGCNNRQEKSDSKKESQQEPKITFQKKLKLQGISFSITATGEGSIKQLSIQPSGLEIDNREILMDIDGQVANAEIEDLNSDGFPELMIYTMSAGSGSYGNVIAYSVNNGKSVSQVYLPDLSENSQASAGYMGHDEFSIVETRLGRRFPIYKEADSNSKPTGGTRQITYRLEDGEASRLFVIDQISEF